MSRENDGKTNLYAAVYNKKLNFHKNYAVSIFTFRQKYGIIKL